MPKILTGVFRRSSSKNLEHDEGKTPGIRHMLTRKFSSKKNLLKPEAIPSPLSEPFTDDPPLPDYPSEEVSEIQSPPLPLPPSRRPSSSQLGRPEPNAGDVEYDEDDDVLSLDAEKNGDTLVIGRRHGALSRDLSPWVNCADYHDVVFHVDGKTVFGHRMILAARCIKFEQMFAGWKPDPEVHDSHVARFVLPQLNCDAFVALLSFLYTGFSEVPRTIAYDLLVCAREFGVEPVVSAVEDALESSLTAESAVWMLDQAQRVGSTRLRHASLAYAARNFSEVSATKSFEQLDHDRILEILAQRLSFAV